MSREPTPSFPKSLLDHHRKELSPVLDRWQKDGQVPPTLLLTGVEGGGTEEFAKHLVQWIFCEKSGFNENAILNQEENSLDLFAAAPEAAPLKPAGQNLLTEPCLQCTSCKRFSQNQVLDFFVISPEESETGKSSSLKIDQLDFIRNQLGFGPKEAPFKVFLIHRADRMTSQAANSLLKILEEPPSRWVFIMTTSDPSLLLPTIISRCQVLRLKPIHPLALEAILVEEGLPSERLRAALDEGAQSYGQSIRWAQDSLWEMRTKVRNFVAQPEKSFSDLLDWASGKHESFIELLDTLDHYGSQILKGAKAPREDLEDKEHLLRLLEKNFETRVRLSAPVNRKLLAQDLLAQWSNANRG